MTTTYLTKTRLEAIIAAVTLAIESAATDISLAELEAARAWAESALAARRQGRSWVGGSGRSRRPAAPNGFARTKATIDRELDHGLDAAACAMDAP